MSPKWLFDSAEPLPLSLLNFPLSVTASPTRRFHTAEWQGPPNGTSPGCPRPPPPPFPPLPCCWSGNSVSITHQRKEAEQMFVLVHLRAFRDSPLHLLTRSKLQSFLTLTGGKLKPSLLFHSHICHGVRGFLQEINKVSVFLKGTVHPKGKTSSPFHLYSFAERRKFQSNRFSNWPHVVPVWPQWMFYCTSS